MASVPAFHSCARLALSSAPQRSPCAALFSGCAGAGVVHTSLRCRHHTAIASPHLSDRTSCVTAAAVVAIAIIVAATVATNTKAPCSDGLNPGCTTATCPHNLSARMPAWMPMRMPVCPRSRSCSNHVDSSSQLASSPPHMHAALTPSSRTMCKPWNSQTLASLAVEGITAQRHRLRMEMVATVGWSVPAIGDNE